MPPEIESEEWATVTTIWTAAGWVGIAVEAIKFFYEFGKTEPLEYEVQRINRELAEIRQRLDGLERRVNDLVLREVANENRDRIRFVDNLARELTSAAFKLENTPSDPSRCAEAAHDAGSIADVFLDDDDLWSWTDIVTRRRHDQDGNVVGEPDFEAATPDFKLAVAYPVYTAALMTWMAAILLHTGGDKAQIQQVYGPGLERHLQAVTLRHGWRDNHAWRTDEDVRRHTPVTVAERIRLRLTCRPVEHHTYARNGKCTYSVICTDTMERSTSEVREFTVQVEDTGPNVTCMIDPAAVVLDEQGIEDAYPAIVGLDLLAEMLASVHASGHLPTEPFVGQFPGWQASMPTVFGVDANGALHRYRQEVTDVVKPMTGPEAIGSGYGYSVTLSAGGEAIFGLGALSRWVRHASPAAAAQNVGWAMEPAGGISNGRQFRLAPTWAYFGGGYGVIYGIVVDNSNDEFFLGDLYWVREENGRFSGIRKVGWGWEGFESVFSVGEGVIYGVLPNGKLRWHRHQAWGNGDFVWDEPRVLNVDDDWRRFARIVTTEDGFIYGTHPNGQVVGYRHLDWKTGGDRFEGPFDGGRGWNAYPTVFGAMPAPLGGVN